MSINKRLYRVAGKVGVTALMMLVIGATAVAETRSNLPVDNRALGTSVERHISPNEPRSQWIRDDSAQTLGDRLERRQVTAQEIKTVKLQNVVPPIRFASGAADIPLGYTALLREVLERVKERKNVRLHFVGHTDNVRLVGAALAKYGDNTELSRERAGTVAEHFKKELRLPAESISYEGVGESRPVASNATDAGRALNRRVEVEVWYDEVTDKLVEKEVVVTEQFNRVKVCRVETLCKLRYKEGLAKRARVRNLMPPLHFDDDTTTIPEHFLLRLRQTLTDLKDKQNLVVKFIGYTDNVPLTGRAERIYGTHDALSKARARRAALAVQDALKLRTALFQVDGKGAAMPLAGNDTEKGRALNRRIEVEFWYDDALQELPDEPQMCPEAGEAETVTRVYDPPSGAIAPILYIDGNPVIPEGYAERLRALMSEIRDKANVRLRFVGYTHNQRLDRRTAMVYGDDIGLSTARARRALAAVKERITLGEREAEFEGHGYVQSDDVVNTGFIESDISRVEVRIVYDELVPPDDNLDITRLTREIVPKDPFALNLMRITVDGKPLDDPGTSMADIARCTDVALDKAKVQFKFDNLEMKPRLNATAWPITIRYRDDPATEYLDNLVQFRMYTNYHSFIDKAEIRLFDSAQSERDVPLAVVAIDSNGHAEWQANFDSYQAPGRELKYVLRVYDADGRFDETKSQSIWIVHAVIASGEEQGTANELLVGYGETRIAVENIAKQGGTIHVIGNDIPEKHSVWVAGRSVPVGNDGKFVAETILPAGVHTVEVGVLDSAGNGELFLRDLEFRKNDWFYVGIADLTVARDKTTGPAKLVTGDSTHYDNDFSLDGRLAYYTAGKFGDGWRLTSSADTLEGPVKEIFTNFLDKSPGALFRRIDPDYHYPTYGDDGTVQEDAPTLGKFYLKLAKDMNYGLWGNFKIGYTDNSLAHVDRGLYGANVHYQSPATTSFGEQRVVVDGFVAEPGTVPARDEFLGTGGSLYFLRHQDILTGSERARIEVRDKDSGVVVAVKNLTAVVDYDIDYLQGRIVLAQPLSATASDDMIVSSDSITGHPTYLVVRYEFTPGFSDADNLAVGGRAHYWFGDWVKLGVTSSHSDTSGTKSSVQGADITLRKSADSWLKLESSTTTGPGSAPLTSNNGGFQFETETLSGDNLSAGARRVDVSIGLKDVYAGANGGKLTLYTQKLDAGYSAPGLVTPNETTQHGGTLQMPLTQNLSMNAKTDMRKREQGLETRAGELDLSYQWTDHWNLSSGLRRDERIDRSPIVPATQVEGERTDVAARVAYDSKGRWSAYGFVQETVEKTGTRENNGRVGSGGSFRITDRLKLTGEMSEGDLGAAGRVGTEYLYSDRTNMYLNYAVENESTDSGLRAKKGSMVSGVRTRYSDSASIYLEERYAHGDVPTGLTHSAGVDLAPADRWNLGARIDFGTVRDRETNAKTERNAFGLHVGYGFDTVKIASVFEYRVDETEAIDQTTSERTTWLMKNSLTYQVNPEWRLIGKFNYADSKTSGEQFFDGKYTEAVLGYGFRPINNDRLNMLFKYTYFYNVPTEGQVTSTSIAADVIQKSHVLALDAMYDINSRWSLGGKYAYRLGRVSLDRTNPQFFDSRAHLYIVRADWRVLRQWDAVIETRLLELPDAGDRRSGSLLALYWHMGNNVKLGIGYNFTDFSDDLTDLSYNSKGLFLNIVGKM
jgi:flagellar motor protein MotB